METCEILMVKEMFRHIFYQQKKKQSFRQKQNKNLPHHS